MQWPQEKISGRPKLMYKRGLRECCGGARPENFIAA